MLSRGGRCCASFVQVRHTRPRHQRLQDVDRLVEQPPAGTPPRTLRGSTAGCWSATAGGCRCLAGRPFQDPQSMAQAAIMAYTAPCQYRRVFQHPHLGRPGAGCGHLFPFRPSSAERTARLAHRRHSSLVFRYITRVSRAMSCATSLWGGDASGLRSSRRIMCVVLRSCPAPVICGWSRANSAWRTPVSPRPQHSPPPPPCTHSPHHPQHHPPARDWKEPPLTTLAELLSST